METEQLLDARRRSLIAAATTWFGAIVVVLAIVVAAFIIDREQATVNDLHKQQQTLQDDVRALAERRDALKAEVNKYQRLSNQLKPFGLAGLGYHKGAMPKQQQLIASLNAHAQARQLETASLQPRGNVELRIFARNLENATNAGVVFPRLRDLGFKVATLRPLLPNIPTNAVWYGSGVDPRNAQLVALTLLAAGAQLRYFGPFVAAKGQKTLWIEVGASKSAFARKQLNTDDIAAIASGKVKPVLLGPYQEQQSPEIAHIEPRPPG